MILWLTHWKAVISFGCEWSSVFEWISWVTDSINNSLRQSLVLVMNESMFWMNQFSKWFSDFLKKTKKQSLTDMTKRHAEWVSENSIVRTMYCCFRFEVFCLQCFIHCLVHSLIKEFKHTSSYLLSFFFRFSNEFLCQQNAAMVWFILEPMETINGKMLLEQRLMNRFTKTYKFTMKCVHIFPFCSVCTSTQKETHLTPLKRARAYNMY